MYVQQLTNKYVRFKAQIYTDRGPTTKFKNLYNGKYILKKNNIFNTPIKIFLEGA